jgi:hypothetical protein
MNLVLALSIPNLLRLHPYLDTENILQKALRKKCNLKLVDRGAISVKEHEEALLNQFNSLFKSQILTPFRTKYRPSQVIAEPSCKMIILVMCANHIDLASPQSFSTFQLFLGKRKAERTAYSTMDASHIRYMLSHALKFGLNSSSVG